MSEASVSQLQEHLELRRQDLNSTLTEIERRLSFEELARSPLDLVQESVLAEYGGNLLNAVSRNPIPVTLLGIGLGWLMIGGQPASQRVGATLQQKAAAVGEKVNVGAEAVGEKAKAGVKSLRERAGETAADLKGRAQESANRLRAGGESTAEASGDFLRQLRRRSKNYGKQLQKHPLALTFAGLAIGAAVAALIPESQTENRVLGEARDQLTEEVKHKSERVMEGARSAIQAGVAAAKGEAEPNIRSGNGGDNTGSSGGSAGASAGMSEEDQPDQRKLQ